MKSKIGIAIQDIKLNLGEIQTACLSIILLGKSLAFINFIASVHCIASYTCS